MEVYKKDNNGYRASPINGKLKGLPFATKHVKGKPLPTSPFGSVRFQVPAEVLLGDASNVFFTDFYCPQGSKCAMHYVTLVVTTRNSAADRFCRDRLLPLDRQQNPFLVQRGNRVYVNGCHRLHVEIFYTDNIDINFLTFHGRAQLFGGIQTFGNGRSKPGGIPKNPRCPICNLSEAHGVYQRF